MVYQVVEAANIAPVVVAVRCLGSAEFEMLSDGSLRLSSQQKCSRPIVARAQFAECAVIEWLLSAQVKRTSKILSAQLPCRLMA
jgi:hypothetical protein